jgi:hypothetical protein
MGGREADKVWAITGKARNMKMNHCTRLFPTAPFRRVSEKSTASSTRSETVTCFGELEATGGDESFLEIKCRIEGSSILRTDWQYYLS